MQEFDCVVRSPDGSIQSHRVPAGNARAARAYLSANQDAKFSRDRIVCITPVSLTWRMTVERFVARFRSKRLSSRDAEFLFEQLSVMLQSGIQLRAAVGEFAVHAPTRQLTLRAAEMGEKIESGNTLSSALRSLGLQLGLALKLIEVGERTGKLAESLEHSTEYLRRRRETSASLMAALAYPCIVAVAALSVAAYLVGWAIPKLATFLSSMGRELPSMTQSLIGLATLLQQYGAAAICIAIVFAVAGLLFCRWPPGRLQLDKLCIGLPMIGNLIRIVETQRFASGMALLLRSGIHLQHALETVVGLHTNRHVRFVVGRIRQRVCDGESFTAALAAEPLFASPLASLVAVGEQTGKLDQAVGNAGVHFDNVLSRRLLGLTRMLEPAIIIVVGSLVAYVYVAFFMALMAASGNFK